MNPPCLSLAALAALAFTSTTALAADATQPPRTVRAAPVGTGDVVDGVELVGELQGIEEVRIYAQMPERIRRLAVKEGDRVKAGDLLVVIAGEVQTHALAQAQATLDATLVQRDAMQDNLKRTRNLAQTGSVSQSQLEQIEAQARGTEAQVRQVAAAVALASAQRDRVIITSPIEGVVSGVAFKEGDVASPAVPILTVVRNDRLRAVLRVPERRFLHVATGMPVTLSPLARPELVVDATVTLKGPVVDRLTRTGLVEAVFDNRDGRLVAGSVIRARIELSRTPNAVLVPASAVLLSADTERSGRAVAFVAVGDKAQRRDVKVGRRQGGDLEVIEGLKAGESLIIQGAHLLRDGNPIRLAAVEPKKAAAETKEQAQ